jgi:phosphopantetheinyl transferase (holo-ACP synthase)
MQIVGIGTDLVASARFRTLKDPTRVARYYLCEEEITAARASRDAVQYFASRFAAKEAVIKAVPEPTSPLSFKIGYRGAKPAVVWLSPAPYSVHLSISHEGEYACAVAICTTA